MINITVKNETDRLLNITGTQIQEKERVLLKFYVLKITVGTMSYYRYDMSESFLSGAEYVATLESEQTVVFTNTRGRGEEQKIRFESVVDSNHILTKVKFDTTGLLASEAKQFRSRILTALKLLDISLGKFKIGDDEKLYFDEKYILDIPIVKKYFESLLGKPKTNYLVKVNLKGKVSLTPMKHLYKMIEEIRSKVLPGNISVKYSKHFDGQGQYNQEKKIAELSFDFEEVIRKYNIVALTALMFHELTHANEYSVTEDDGYTIDEIKGLNADKRMNNAESLALVYQLVIARKTFSRNHKKDKAEPEKPESVESSRNLDSEDSLDVDMDFKK